MIRAQGLYVGFGERVDPTVNRRVHRFARSLLADPIDGLTDLYPGNVNVYVEFDANTVTRRVVEEWLIGHLASMPTALPDQDGGVVTLDVTYDGADLAEFAAGTGRTVDDIVRLHSSERHRVYAVGFVPGQPMLGPIDGNTADHPLYVPRRATPRARVPAGSLGVAVGQTTIYPLPTPGGWHLIGTVHEAMYDPHRAEPFLLAAGDSVRFRPVVDAPAPLHVTRRDLLPTEPRRPALRVEEPGPLDLVVDQGRRMAARFGMAQSGPVDPIAARIANAVVANPADTPLVEMTVRGPRLTALTDLVVACVGEGMAMVVDGLPRPSNKGMAIRSGESITFTPQPRGCRAYLAIGGGIESDLFLASASTDLNGMIGRPLQAGDVLGTAFRNDLWAGLAMTPPALADFVEVRLLAGPQATDEALDGLTSGPFTVSTLDRMGARFEGPKVPAGPDLISEATPLGAVQVTVGGDPIVLLNDRGRIGGYSKPAVIDPRDLRIIGQLRPGQIVRFLPPPSTSNAHWHLDASATTRRPASQELS